MVREKPQRVEFISFTEKFHGRTMGALSVTGQAKYRQGFGPMVGDVRFIPFGDPSRTHRHHRPTCAVTAEPIQAEGGINLPPPGYLQELRRLCSERGALLIFDEIQTGVGRTGTFYAFEREAMVPDIVTLAKGLAGACPWAPCWPAKRSNAPSSQARTPPPLVAIPWRAPPRSTSNRPSTSETYSPMPGSRSPPGLGAVASGRAAQAEDAGNARPWPATRAGP